MNIVDILNGKKPSELSNKIAINSEKKKIERRADDFIDQVIDFISSEANFIQKGLVYGSSEPSKIEDSDVEDLLTNCLKKVFLQLPEKLSSELKDIFSCENKENGEKEKEEEKQEPEKKVIEIASNVPVSAPTNYFGY